MPPRRRPTIRLLLLAALTVTAALSLTACDDGEGLRDEGPSALTRGLGPAPDFSPAPDVGPAPDVSGASARPPSPSR